MHEMDIDEFAAMIEDTPIHTRVVEYRTAEHSQLAQNTTQPTSNDSPEELVAACLTDTLSDGLSLVYSFYDPEAAKRSLGTYIILDHIDLARELGLPYVYLGFWVRGSRKMDYKIQFQPAEVLIDQGWTPYDEYL